MCEKLLRFTVLSLKFIWGALVFLSLLCNTLLLHYLPQMEIQTFLKKILADGDAVIYNKRKIAKSIMLGKVKYVLNFQVHQWSKPSHTNRKIKHFDHLDK